MYILENGEPLVSIIVITYNSSGFIKETLDSAKNQTYSNIELIISDDGSSDETLNICNEWIKINKESFVRVELITTNKNTGVTANCNRGWHKAKGDWVKFIAGDDALLPNCITDNFNFIKKNKEASIVHSKKLIYLEHFEDTCFLQESAIETHHFNFPQITASKQHELLLRKNHVVAPSVFIKRELLQFLNGFDERIPMIEDWPFWIKATSEGNKIFFLNKATVKYRLHNASISLPQSKLQIFSNYDQKLESIYSLYIYSKLPLIEKILYAYDFKRMKVMISLGMNKNYKLLKILNKITGFPPSLYRKLKIKSLSLAKKGF